MTPRDLTEVPGAVSPNPWRPSSLPPMPGFLPENTAAACGGEQEKPEPRGRAKEPGRPGRPCHFRVHPRVEVGGNIYIYIYIYIYIDI